MALSGLEIYKLLPKTNCRKCGFPTCLAFAMQLAKKAVSLDQCPFLTPETKKILEESSLPPIRLITIKREDNTLEIGNESVMFRHEEKFYHPTGIGIILNDDLSDGQLNEILEMVKKLEFERVGQRLKIDLLAIRNRSMPERFLEVVEYVIKNTTLPLVYMSENPSILRQALKISPAGSSLIYRATAKNFMEFAQLSKDYKTPLVVSADNLEELSNLTKQFNQQEIEDLVLEVKSDSAAICLWQLTQIRRLALKKKERSLGYPCLVVVETKDKDLDALFATTYIAKYAGIVLLDLFQPEEILSILTLRQNIYTDPQRPLQIEPKLYPVGNAKDDSFVLVTTNFSLTYYTVLGEVEASKVPAYILSVNTEGMSVLTAWAAEKFTANTITEAIHKHNLKEIISRHRLIIPGYVAILSGDLEDKSGWQVIVGPKEAAGIPAFLKNLS